MNLNSIMIYQNDFQDENIEYCVVFYHYIDSQDKLNYVILTNNELNN